MQTELAPDIKTKFRSCPDSGLCTFPTLHFPVWNSKSGMFGQKKELPTFGTNVMTAYGEEIGIWGSEIKSGQGLGT
jgi:hypothetical protein